MSITFQYSTYLLATLVAGSVLLGGCKKDKVPNVEPVELTKWEKISGNYKVFDTLGVYLYDMNIIYIHNDQDDIDSLRFENFDGEFDIVAQQVNASNYSQMLIRIGYHDTLYDSIGNRWKLLYTEDDDYNNIWENDTIKMNFGKTNINYYIEDLTPYYACNCKQIAVKQP